MLLVLEAPPSPPAAPPSSWMKPSAGPPPSPPLRESGIHFQCRESQPPVGEAANEAHHSSHVNASSSTITTTSTTRRFQYPHHSLHQLWCEAFCLGMLVTKGSYQHTTIQRRTPKNKTNKQTNKKQTNKNQTNFPQPVARLLLLGFGPCL